MINKIRNINTMNRYIVISVLAPILLLSGCKASERILYLQDIEIDNPIVIEQQSNITIQSLDMISIIVSSKDWELATPFNLPIVSYDPGRLMGTSVNNRISGYTVDENGDIDFPVLGKLHIAGLTRSEVSNLVKNSLIKSELLRDPMVTVEFMNMYLSVLGEVRNPGRFVINRDQITLLDALSMAGDLTIQGRRDGIYVIREENGIRTNYRIDLRSADLFRSPVYYMKQNDVIYVRPNKVRAGQSTANENNFRSVAVWTSISSTIVTLIVLLTRNNNK